MGRFARRLLVRGMLLLGPASVGYYLWQGITGSAEDRWYGAAMVYMIIALNLITPALLLAESTAPRAERAATRLGRPELAEGIEQSRAWTDNGDPMSHPLYHSAVGIPVRVQRITDMKASIRTHPVVRLGVRGETGAEFDVVAVVPRIAVPRIGDIVRVVTDVNDPTRYRYAGPAA